MSVRERWLGISFVESARGRRARAVHTRVVLQGGFAVGGFDLVGGRGAVEVEDLVGVDGRGFGICDVFGR